MIRAFSRPVVFHREVRFAPELYQLPCSIFINYQHVHDPSWFWWICSWFLLTPRSAPPHYNDQSPLCLRAVLDVLMAFELLPPVGVTSSSSSSTVVNLMSSTWLPLPSKSLRRGWPHHQTASLHYHIMITLTHQLALWLWLVAGCLVLDQAGRIRLVRREVGKWKWWSGWLESESDD